MNRYDALQWLVIALAVAWSIAFGLARLFPRAHRRLRAHLAGGLMRSPHARLRILGTRLMPNPAATGGCGSGCSTCGGCAMKAATAARVSAAHEKLERFRST